MKEDNRIFTGWIFVLAPPGASTPLVVIVIILHPLRDGVYWFCYIYLLLLRFTLQGKSYCYSISSGFLLLRFTLTGWILLLFNFSRFLIIIILGTSEFTPLQPKPLHQSSCKVTCVCTYSRRSADLTNRNDLDVDLCPRSHEWRFAKMAISRILSKIFSFRFQILKACIWG